MSHLVDKEKLEQFATYADKHDIYSLFKAMTTKLLAELPEDPIQFMIDYIQTPKTPAVIVIAPPASGISRITRKLAQKLQAVHVSIREVIDRNIHKQTSMAAQLKSYVDKGELIPDDLITSLVLARLNEDDVKEYGWVIEGFPKTKSQAALLLKNGFAPKHLLEFDVPIHHVISRAKDLRYDPVLDKNFHLIDDPPANTDITQSRLVVLTENESPIINRRLVKYRHQVMEIARLYKDLHVHLDFPKGLFSEPEGALVARILPLVGIQPITTGPRLFKIIVAGLPGSGRETISEMISRNYGCVIISPKRIILQEIAKNTTESLELAPFIDSPDDGIIFDGLNLAPLSRIGPLIKKYIEREDCKEKGWVMHGFPRNNEQAEYLHSMGLDSNRLIWLDGSEETCSERLATRSFDGENLQIEKKPEETKTRNAANLDSRFKLYANSKAELESVYRINRMKSTGIMYIIHDDGDLNHVMEKVEASLLRPVPFKI